MARVGLIPASAGEPMSTGSGSSESRAYPRERGGTPCRSGHALQG